MIVKSFELDEFKEDELVEFIDNHEKTQVVSRDLVTSRKNVEHAVKSTEKAYEQDRNISHVPKIGLLLHLTGKRQIKDAIKEAKVKDEKAVFICFDSDPEETWKDFKRKFSFKETDLPTASEEEIKEHMEKTSTFWLEQ